MSSAEEWSGYATLTRSIYYLPCPLHLPVGRVRPSLAVTRRPPNPTWFAHEISACLPAWRFVFLYGGDGETAPAVSSFGGGGELANGVPGGADHTPVRSRGDGCVARSPALHLDAAAWGCRFCNTLAASQDLVHQTLPIAYAAESRADVETRAGGMAAPVLGTSVAGRSRFCPTCGVHSLQSGQTRVGPIPDTMAAL